MRVEISESTYRAVAAVHSDVSLFVEWAAKDALKRTDSGAKPRFDAEQLLADTRNFQGMFGNATLDEVLADRRCGIE